MNGEWEPFLANLHEQGEMYARGGVAFSSWLLLISAFRDAVRHEMSAASPDAGVATRLGDGLSRFIDVVVGGLAEAYLAERTRTLRESEEKYRLLFDASPLPMWVFDAESLAFLAVNDAAIRHYGWTREEFLRMSIRDIRPSADVPQLMSDVATQAVRSEAQIWRHRRKDGADIDVEISAHALQYEGRPARLVLAHDVTARKATEDRARALETQLQQSQKMDAIGRLAGGLAHDFNNLLTVIISYSGIVLQDLRPGDPMTADVEEIRSAGTRAAELTRQLLAFSRQQKLEAKPLDLNAVVSGMDGMFRRLVSENIKVGWNPGAGLGEVRADRHQLEQVLLNLVVNARDAMPDGGRLTIETSNMDLDERYAAEHAGVKPGPHVMLAVSDTGTGMDKETQARIFEPFFTTKPAGKGTGLGLATVFGIVKQSGGSIWVYSEPGKGTTFKIYLPRTGTGSAAANERPSGPSTVSPRGTETILLVEDENAVRRLAREVLRRQGYDVLEAKSAAEALVVCEQSRSPIHLLLTDVIMPGMNGRELATRVKSNHPDTAVLFMSGYAPSAIISHDVLEEGLAFLQKPLTPETLSAAVRKALDDRAPG